MDVNVFYFGLAIGIIMGFSIFIHLIRSYQLNNDLQTPLDLMELSISNSLASVQEVQSCQDSDKRSDIIRRKQHILTNQLVKLDQIEDPQYRALRKATIVYIQTVQDHLDTYL
jgi:hypothetical protein